MPCRNFAYRLQPTRQNLVAHLVGKYPSLPGRGQISSTVRLSIIYETAFLMPITGSRITKGCLSRKSGRMISAGLLVARFLRIRHFSSSLTRVFDWRYRQLLLQPSLATILVAPVKMFAPRLHPQCDLF